jgi:hypothetical protein
VCVADSDPSFPLAGWLCWLYLWVSQHLRTTSELNSCQVCRQSVQSVDDLSPLQASMLMCFAFAGFYSDVCCGWKTSTECRATEDLQLQIFSESFRLSDLSHGKFLPIGPSFRVTNITLYCCSPASGLRGELNFPLSGVSLS